MWISCQFHANFMWISYEFYEYELWNYLASSGVGYHITNLERLSILLTITTFQIGSNEFTHVKTWVNSLLPIWKIWLVTFHLLWHNLVSRKNNTFDFGMSIFQIGSNEFTQVMTSSKFTTSNFKLEVMDLCYEIISNLPNTSKK